MLGKSVVRFQQGKRIRVVAVDVTFISLPMVMLGSHFVSKYSTYPECTVNIRSGLSLHGNVF